MEEKLHSHTSGAVLLLLLLEWLLSLAAGLVGTWLAAPLRVASYLVPIAVFLLFMARRDELLAHRPQRGSLMRVLPLLPIFLSAVLLVSALTGFLMQLLSLPVTGGGATAGGGLLTRILSHALLPALLEETLMRLCVLTLLARRSPARAVPQSALLFALLHANLYQLPYAFVGGIFLALATQMGGSVLYAMLFHFANNLLSLLMQALPAWLGEAAGLYAGLGIAALLFALAAVGLTVLLRREGAKAPPKTRAWLRELLCSPLLLYVILMLLYACL